MFGSNRVKELEERLHELQNKLDQATAQKTDLEQKLSGAQRKAAELEEKLNNTDLEALKEEARASKAEYEGLKDLYTKKIQEFDNSKEEKEQQFAREAAIQRFNLDNEIRDNRQANQDYVTETVKTFSESYNYYLNQIKLLMDALGDVAAKTGSALFAEENGDLKAKFGLQMADKLRSDTDALRTDTGDLILIGGSTEDADRLAEEEALDAAPEEEPACDEPCAEIEEACEAPEEAAEPEEPEAEE